MERADEIGVGLILSGDDLSAGQCERATLVKCIQMPIEIFHE